jgi:multimeric flavodoxin WrbA
MKIVSLLGSPRSKGNSASIVGRFNESAARLGAVVKTYELNRLAYQGCQGCYACKKGGEECVLQDDLTEVLAAVRQSDVVVLASSVYFGDVTAQMKGFIDRCFSYFKPDFHTNPEPSRLKQKKLVFVITQGNPDQEAFSGIFSRYDMFLKWLGFHDTRLIRVYGIGPATVDAVPEAVLRQAEEMARTLVS